MMGDGSRGRQGAAGRRRREERERAAGRETAAATRARCTRARCTRAPSLPFANKHANQHANQPTNQPTNQDTTSCHTASSRSRTSRAARRSRRCSAPTTRRWSSGGLHHRLVKLWVRLCFRNLRSHSPARRGPPRLCWTRAPTWRARTRSSTVRLRVRVLARAFLQPAPRTII